MHGADILESGWPKTTRLVDETGRTAGYRIIAAFQTPGGAKLTGLLATLSGVGFLIATLWPWAGVNLMVKAVPAALLQIALYYTLKRLTVRKTVITVTAQTITIGQKSWDTATDHFYSMLPHRRAEREGRNEQIWQQREQAEGHPARHYPNRHYRESFHIALHSLDQRIPIADVYGERWAVKLLERLKGISRFMSNQAEIQSLRRAAR